MVEMEQQTTWEKSKGEDRIKELFECLSRKIISIVSVVGKGDI